MTTPNTNASGNAGYGSTSTSTPGTVGDAGTGAERNSNISDGRTDDVSFAKSIGVDHALEAATDAAQKGATNVEDAVTQLQSKATEFANNLIDRVNVDDLTQKLEEQVRDHPARTLLLAAGAGFLLGRAAKK